jgi:hypothetical protein
MLRRSSFVVLALTAACSSKSSDPPPADSGIVEDTAPAAPPIARFVVPAALSELAAERWFDHPWPSDVRRDPGEGPGLGPIHTDQWPNPRGSKLIAKYLEQIRGKIDGFSPAAGGYLAFDGPIDEALLPADATASLDARSTLQLVDVDGASPDVGKRSPIFWKWRERVGDYYLAPNTLSFGPSLGHSMRRGTRYAIVVTRELAGPGGPAAPNAELSAVLEGKGAVGAAWAPALAELAKVGVAKERIAHLSVFTTGDPIAETLKLADHARSLPPPKLKAIVDTKTSTDGFDKYEGTYEGSPDYQAGTPPFANEGGGLVFDADGKPVVQRTFELRFLLMVPNATKCPMPADGYPLVMYAHGTNGDYASFIKDGTADALIARCVASMGVDQIFHGTRPGAPPLTDPDRDTKIQLAFFNLSNATAARTNTRQSAIDELARARLIATGGLVVPPEVSATGAAVKFDPKRIGFFGHSQGGLNGALLLSIDDQVKGGVLSGAGSAIAYSLLLKVKPEPSVASLVKNFLGITVDNQDELGPLHPAITLVQTIEDPADPLHYYPGIARAPFPGRVAKSVFMTEGVAADGSGDNYAPPRTIEAGAIAGGFPLLSPVVWDVPEITVLGGRAPVAPPLKGNAAGGKATVALAQFVPPKGSDGHFVVFRVPEAKAQSMSFCASLLNDDVPTIAAP